MIRIIAGEFKGRLLATPKGSSTRPTLAKVRAMLFNMCQMEMEGAHFLDLCAGSGAMGFEALSRGAATVTFVENGREACRTIEKNIELLKVENRAIKLFGDVLKILKQIKGKYHFIYLDPPYGGDLIEALLKEIEGRELLHVGGRLFVEESDTVELPQEVGALYKVDARRVGGTLLWQYKRGLNDRH